MGSFGAGLEIWDGFLGLITEAGIVQYFDRSKQGCLFIVLVFKDKAVACRVKVIQVHHHIYLFCIINKHKVHMHPKATQCSICLASLPATVLLPEPAGPVIAITKCDMATSYQKKALATRLTQPPLFEMITRAMQPARLPKPSNKLLFG